MSQTSEQDKESLARTQLPYRAEYCKTSRAKCKKCTEPMEANSLKLANMVKSRFHDGYDANFYHVACFFRIKRPATVAEICHFETLKYEDQKMLEKAVETKGLSVLGDKVDHTQEPDKTKGSKSSKQPKGKKRSAKEAAPAPKGEVLVNYDDFMVEYAKSGRAKCIRCEEKIEKDSVRLGKLDYEAETQWNGGPLPRWYHVDCFVKSMEQLEFYGLVEKIRDFKELDEADRKMLKKKVKPIEVSTKLSAEIGGKKIKDEKQDAAAAEEERLLREQSDRFFKLREKVNSMKRKDIETMLEFMRQRSQFKSPALLIDMATDVLLFGPLEKCPVCKKRGGMVLRGSSYICTEGSEENPCTYETREPRRGAPDVPAEVFEKYEFFENYEFIAGKRIFPSKFLKAVEQKQAEDNNLVLAGAPLDGINIGVISWMGVQADKLRLQKKVVNLGGKILTALDRSVFVILSSEEQLAKENDPKVEVAKALEVPFATPEFIFKIETKDDVVPQVERCLIGSQWSGRIEARFKKMTKKPKVEPK